jgi:hypothetical protein
VPWCEPCSRFLSPATVTADGRCPSCGRVVEPGRARTGGGPASSSGSPVADPAAVDGTPREGLPPIPWHFKVLCAAATLYLGWRAVQGIEWLAGRL